MYNLSSSLYSPLPKDYLIELGGGDPATLTEESANFTSFLGSKIKDKYFPLIDIGIAAAHITLAAEAEGLGSCILGWFDEKAFKALAGIPEGKRILLDIVVGYPTKPKRKKSRKEARKVVSFNKYGEWEEP